MEKQTLPLFSNIDIARFPELLDGILKSNMEQITALCTQQTNYTWNNLMRPLEDMEDKLEKFWSPMAHLHAVVNTPELRACYQSCLPKLSVYESAVGHNQALYEAIKSIKHQDLDNTQVKIINDAIRDFEVTGVALPSSQKQRFEAIQARLAELSNQFENHILDAEQAFKFHITDASRLSGLPEHTIHHAKQLAEANNLKGWVLNLEIPCFLAVITYADDRSLRETLYQAYITRASDQGPNAGEFDNSAIMDEILELRHEKAQILGFEQYAQLSLVTKMADSCQQVVDFLLDLKNKAYPQAQKEFKELQKFAEQYLDLTNIEPWDIAYISEKQRKQQHDISQEALRPYLPLPKVMTGLFSILHKLYGIHMQQIDDVDKWHPDVTCYAISDENKNLCGYIYFDLFARSHKRGGAWMNGLQSRRKLADGHIQPPIATLTCNFTSAVGNKPATLSHDEVLTLFHELGHCLHHVLTKVDYLSAAGTHAVEWDAVELPSQFFENWCWEQSALNELTAHIDTNEPLPTSLFEKLIAARNFQSAMSMVRQIEFSLFDFHLHQHYHPNEPDFISTTLNNVRKQTCVVPIVAYNRFQHSFAHIFAGGYAAGYYSYKWAEVLSSDAFARFEEEGIFNHKTGLDFLHHILEVGGAKKAADAFMSFRGRPPSIAALLRHNGID